MDWLSKLTYGTAIFQPREAGRGDAGGVTGKRDWVADGLQHSLVRTAVDGGGDCT